MNRNHTAIQNSSRAEELREVIGLIEKLSPLQMRVVRSIIERFALGWQGEHPIQSFLSPEAYEYFGMRLAAHHAQSSHMLKKEAFEHILEQAFRAAGIPTELPNSMTHRGADIIIGTVPYSLKTEAARDLKLQSITISKLMEAAWIKQITSLGDIPPRIASMVMPHFANYRTIFMLRCYRHPTRPTLVRYDLREIPTSVLAQVGVLTPADFTPLTRTRTTSAEVRVNGRVGFKFRLDGSDDKLTINNLDVSLCPLHAWWMLEADAV
jgi:hypothetical protein